MKEPVFNYELYPKDFSEFTCYRCKVPMGYFHDCEHEVMQSVMLCPECFAWFSCDSSQRASSGKLNT